jgi:hypothetical protein
LLNLIESFRFGKLQSGDRKKATSHTSTFKTGKARNQTFEEIAGYKPNGFVLLNNGEAEQVQGMRITANFLPLLRVTPVLGRNFARNEEQRGSQKVALISYDFWQTRFGGEPNVLNRQESLNGEEFTIIGVLPQHFRVSTSIQGRRSCNDSRRRIRKS